MESWELAGKPPIAAQLGLLSLLFDQVGVFEFAGWSVNQARLSVLFVYYYRMGSVQILPLKR